MSDNRIRPNNWVGVEKLYMVEAYADDAGFISSEEELSEVFDAIVAPHVIGQYGADDSVAMREAFNNWSDGLCKDGVIHTVQYEEYCYVGEYDD